jgi:hypothetical protein
MARRSERREEGRARLRDGGETKGDGTRAGKPGGGSTPRSDGSMPRNTISDGSTPCPSHGAAMARTSDGSKPREISGASIAHKERLPGMASPRELFPPTKELTDAEFALAARQSRLRREAGEADMKVSASALVRERFSGSARTSTGPGAEGEEASKVTRRSAARNTQRLRAADASDAFVIGESTSSGACSSCFDRGEKFRTCRRTPSRSSPDPSWDRMTRSNHQHGS